jgi:hypothetical protein
MQFRNYGTHKDQISLDFLSKSQLFVSECGSSSFNNKTPQMLPHYHHIGPTKSWTKIKNNVGNCEKDPAKPSNAHLFLNLQSSH